MLLALLAIVFLVVPLAELYVIIQVVGPAIGAPATILLLCADSLLGAYLLRSQGRAVWRRFTRALSDGRMPHREVMDGVLVIFGGAFLITPGFITDVLGVLLLLPPTRAVVRRGIMRKLGRRMLIDTPASPRRGGPQADYDVEGSATEYDVPSPRLER